MTLNASGPLSLGGSTAGQSVNLELGQSATATISMNDANVRALAGVSSGAISLPNNFWNKSAIQYYFGFLGLSGSAASVNYDGVFTDSSNNIYVYGNLSGGQYQKFNSAGVFQSQYQLSAPNAVTGDMAFAGKGAFRDSSGNMYWSAYITGAGIGTVKLNSSGAILWKNYVPAPTTTGTSANQVAVDSSGNVYTVGSMTTATSGLTAGNAYINKRNSSGVIQWQRHLFSQYGFHYASYFYSCTCDSSGNIYVGGQVDGGAWLVKYDSSGTVLWNKSVIPAFGQATFGGVAIGSDGYIYCFGRYDISDGTNAITGIIAKFDSSGNAQWYKALSFGGGAYSNASLDWNLYPLQIVLDSSNNVYLSAPSPPATRQYIVSFDSSGNLRWGNQIQCTTSSSASYPPNYSMALRSDGAIVVANDLGSPGPVYTSYIGVLPSDGSKTGTYTNGFGIQFSYASASGSMVTISPTISAYSPVTNTPTYTDATINTAVSSTSYTMSVTNI